MAASVRLPAPLPERRPLLLTVLRAAASECRTSARLDMPRAFAALNPGTDAAGLAAVLVRALPQVMPERPYLRPPGAPGTSFDEDWLLALGDAIRRGDRPSERFLLTRRCHARGAPCLALLMRALAARLGT
jgi:hypothetical protein